MKQLEAIFKSVMRTRGYYKRNDTRYSELQSSNFVLEKKVDKNSVLRLIEKLVPYNVGLDLVRLGHKGDGGYLLPDDLEGIEACFSPGVADVSKFEYDCGRKGMKLFLADKSVEKPKISLPESEYDFLQKFIGCYDDDEFITMDTWVNGSGVNENSDLLLQMDIEGAEYISFINMSEALLKRFRIIVLELHTLEKLWQKEFNFFFNAAISKLMKSHTCVHIHPNNCCGEETHENIRLPRVAEFSFIRNDRILSKENIEKLPHELDEHNTAFEGLSLSEIWYKPQH